MSKEMKSREQNSETPRRTYEKPSIRMMTEREILNQFQITQSMAVWWATAAC